MSYNMPSDKQYDELLYPILTSEGNIIDFFDKIFDFLNRRTDYFKIKKDTSSKVGLEMGEAEKIIRSAFCKYMEQAVAQYKLELRDREDPVSLDYIAEEVVTTTDADPVKDIEMSTDTEKEMSKVTNTSKIDEPDQQSEPKIPWMDPDCYNGARYDDYAWAQSLKDVDIRIKVPKNVTIGKHVKVVINRSSISTEVLSNGSWNILRKGDLSWPINIEESTWTLVPGEHIHICLQKLQQKWWDSCFIDEPKINLRCIDPSMPYEDLDEESQAKINELMYNEQQKRLGKPTISQKKVQNILKEAWDAEGSPFKGQPFDPSLVDVQNVDNL